MALFKKARHFYPEESLHQRHFPPAGSFRNYVKIQHLMATKRMRSLAGIETKVKAIAIRKRLQYYHNLASSVWVSADASWSLGGRWCESYFVCMLPSNREPYI